MRVVIIDYGAGNIKSIQFAFKRLGIEAILSNDPECILNADKVIFPGVGEASTAMRSLKNSGLDKLIPKLKQPVLGICLGMQLYVLFRRRLLPVVGYFSTLIVNAFRTKLKYHKWAGILLAT